MKTFPELFGSAFTSMGEAPGRVNLIGEHTDYNGGFVLPTTIPQKTRVELRPREDRKVRVASGNQGDEILEYTLGEETVRRHWTDYVKGITSVLLAQGYPLRGFEARLESAVPVGSGLSSSAALEVSLLRALRSAFSLAIDDVAIAKAGQQAENEFVGARVGIMDQMAASLARDGEALFLDTRHLAFKRLPLPTHKMELIVINSGVSHRSVQGDYNQRRAECEEACRRLGVDELRDLGTGDLVRLMVLPETLRKRARHVITENQRVLEAALAIERADMEKLGRLFDQSHLSMRDDYAVSVPEVDLLVALAQSEEDVYGARLTGGGFGGSIVALCRPGTAKAVARRVAQRYGEGSPRRGTVLVPADAHLDPARREVPLSNG